MQLDGARALAAALTHRCKHTKFGAQELAVRL